MCKSRRPHELIPHVLTASLGDTLRTLAGAPGMDIQLIGALSVEDFANMLNAHARTTQAAKGADSSLNEFMRRRAAGNPEG